MPNEDANIEELSKDDATSGEKQVPVAEAIKYRRRAQQAESQLKDTRQKLEELVTNGRLPITTKNIQIIPQDPGKGYKKLALEKSRNAGLTLIGFREDAIKHQGNALFSGFEEMGNILFVNSHSQKEI